MFGLSIHLGLEDVTLQWLSPFLGDVEVVRLGALHRW